MTFKLRYRVMAWTLAACSLAALAPVAGAAAGADAVGVWKGPMDTQMGVMETTITIATTAPLAGRVKVGDFDAAIANGKLDGAKISFEITIEPGTVAYEGTVGENEMTLNVTGTTGNKMTLVAKRQK